MDIKIFMVHWNYGEDDPENDAKKVTSEFFMSRTNGFSLDDVRGIALLGIDEVYTCEKSRNKRTVTRVA